MHTLRFIGWAAPQQKAVDRRLPSRPLWLSVSSRLVYLWKQSIPSTIWSCTPKKWVMKMMIVLTILHRHTHQACNRIGEGRKTDTIYTSSQEDRVHGYMDTYIDTYIHMHHTYISCHHHQAALKGILIITIASPADQKDTLLLSSLSAQTLVLYHDRTF